jgi:hypothetical protein
MLYHQVFVFQKFCQIMTFHTMSTHLHQVWDIKHFLKRNLVKLPIVSNYHKENNMWHDQKKKGLSRIYGFKKFNYLFQIGVMMMMIIIIMTWPPCYCAIPLMMNWWRNIDFMEIKFQLNDIACTLNWKNMGWKYDAN